MALFCLHDLKKCLSIVKKIFLVFLVYFVVVSLFFYFINKNKPRTAYDLIQKNREEIYKIINDKNINSTQEGKITITIYRAMMCTMIGELCTNNPNDGDKNFNKSLFGLLSNLIVLPYANPPASGIYWAYSGLQNAGFIPKTYAAEGIGFAAIKPFINIWKIFRDLAYMILVLVLIAIGFMIMFRMKLNPQTVISVENAIPKIVISLLLITFSFAIAGFLIDLMYVIMALGISILAPPHQVARLQNEFLTASPALLFDKLFFINRNYQDIPEFILIRQLLGPLGFAIDQINIIFNMFLIGVSLLGILPGFITIMLLVANVVVSVIAAVKLSDFGKTFVTWLEDLGIATLQAGNFIPGLLWVFIFIIAIPILILVLMPIIIGFLVFLAMILLFFRIFFILLSSYLKIILMIILSPLLLILEAIPGKNIFSSWFKNIFAELSIFPLVAFIILIGNLILNSSSFTSLIPFTTQNWTPPFLYNLNQYAYQFVIAFGIVLILPDIIKLWKETLGVKGLPFNIGLGTFFAGVGAGLAGAQTGIGLFTGLSQMPFIGHRIAQTSFYREAFGPPPSEITGVAVATQMEKILSEKYGLKPKSEQTS